MHAVGPAALEGVIPLPCAGRLDLATVLWAFAAGCDGLLLLACPPDECRHRCQRGDCDASGAAVVARARDVLGSVGLSPRRVVRRTVRNVEDIATVTKEFTGDIERLGRWKVEHLPPPSPDPEPMLVDRCLRLLAHVQAVSGSARAAPRCDGGDVLWPGCLDLRMDLAGAADLVGTAGRHRGRLGLRDASIGPRCCGRPLLVAGEIDAFAVLARANAEVIRASGAERVVTACPHCAETLNTSYAEVGARIDVPVIDIPGLAAERVARERWPATLDEPGPATMPEGPALRRMVTSWMEQAARSGASAVVLASPHVAAVARAVVAQGSWQTGPAIPILDLGTELIELTGREVVDGR
jgi:coenzyme F420-reducing hydrogenase delta subunit